MKKLFSFVLIAVMALTMATPSFAATRVKIKSNAKNSKNIVKLNDIDVTHVDQSNTTLAGVLVVQAGNTGKNDIKDSTGGDADIRTGDVSNSATVNVTGGDNTATVSDPCGCPDGDTSVKIKGNGENSFNLVEVNNIDVTYVSQTNLTGALVGVVQLGNTGGNDIKGTTGGDGSGDPKIVTNDVTNSATITVSGSDNKATL